MNERLKNILTEAQKLSAEEREELAGLLLSTIEVDPEIEAIWAAEIADRIAAHKRGELSTRPAAEVLAKHLKA
jgi:hypothetical protein